MQELSTGVLQLGDAQRQVQDLYHRFLCARNFEQMQYLPDGLRSGSSQTRSAPCSNLLSFCSL
jgi:hypothetical protein